MINISAFRRHFYDTLHKIMDCPYYLFFVCVYHNRLVDQLFSQHFAAFCRFYQQDFLLSDFLFMKSFDQGFTRRASFNRERRQARTTKKKATGPCPRAGRIVRSFPIPDRLHRPSHGRSGGQRRSGRGGGYRGEGLRRAVRELSVLLRSSLRRLPRR